MEEVLRCVTRKHENKNKTKIKTRKKIPEEDLNSLNSLKTVKISGI